MASTETKSQNTRSAPRGAAVFIVDSLILISHFFTARMIVMSINLQRYRIYTHFRGFLQNIVSLVLSNTLLFWKQYSAFWYFAFSSTMIYWNSPALCLTVTSRQRSPPEILFSTAILKSAPLFGFAVLICINFADCLAERVLKLLLLQSGDAHPSFFAYFQDFPSATSR